MRLQLNVALACLISLLWIQQILCDELSGTSGVNKWTCTCSSAHQGNQSFVISNNCSSSCDCSPAIAGESTGNRWICICDADRFPKVVTDSYDTSCFTDCNCNSGSSSDVQPSKKHVSSKVIVIILLICLVVTAIVSIVSLLCYVYKRDKCPIRRPLFSLDKESSYNSATNLINHWVPENSFYIGSPENRMTGCIHKSSFFFRSRPGTLHGTIKQFPYSELENATNKFSDSNLIGLGGSCRVYSGHLKDGRVVAVKRMKALLGPDAESVFATEIEVISRLHHCHVVPLLGYCSEYQGKKHPERLLVFEYMANGNLRECLDAGSGKCLNWVTRVGIALGAARGLEYLHEAAAPRILHRDVKSTNILLDDNWRAKITDLGMAKRLRTNELPSCSNSPARMQGTFGYFAPEYAIIGRASLKSDVFSFGVVLLELISGRHPINKSADKREESLVIWAMPILQDSKRVISELPDPRLEGKFPDEDMQIMAYLAKECLLMDPDSRPTMSEVVQILSTIVSDKSRRRNFQLNLLQSLSMSGPTTELEIETTDKQQVQKPVVSEELRQMEPNKWSPRCSLPLNIDRTLCLEKNARASVDAPSVEYTDKIVLLTSDGRSCRTHEDEAADLTEPRFESFHVATIRTPS